MLFTISIAIAAIYAVNIAIYSSYAKWNENSCIFLAIWYLHNENSDRLILFTL